jgi:chromosome segregation ATPase
MSMIQKLKDLEANIAALEAAGVTAAQAHAEALSALESKHADAIKAIESEKGVLVAQLFDANTAKTALEAEKAKDAEALAAVSAKITEAVARAESAEKRLSNPAFEDASAKGVAPVSDGGEAPGGGSTNLAPHWAEFEAIKDAGKRTAYWNANADALRAESKFVK